MPKRQRPTHKLTLVSKEAGVDGKRRYSDVGAAWKNDIGISIVINPGVVLDYKTSNEFYINLYPAERTFENREISVEDGYPPF